MAVDLAARPGVEPKPLVPARVTAVPVQLLLATLVGASFAIRLAAALAHATPLYFPDEYIYASLARSLAESGRPAIRGVSAHFPALLEPLLAAPFWLGHDPQLAYRLTQGLNVLAMSLAAIPAYLLARRLDLREWTALACAAVAVASPDLLFASFVMADPIAYPLVLGALAAGVSALAAPTRRAQLAFVALAGLATFARVQYVVVPAAFVVAALALDHRRAFRLHRLPLALLALPVAGLLAIGPSRLLGYYAGIAHLKVSAGAVVHWIAVDAMMLAYSTGWVLVPGALVGLALALVRPRARVERGFALLAGAFAAGIFLEAGLYAASGSTRYQERYLFALIPLAAPAFALYVARGWPGRLAVLVASAALLLLSVQVPLSGFVEAENKQDSPFLFAVFRLEALLGVGEGALLVAALAAVLSALAAVCAWRRRGAALVFALAVAASAAASLGSFSFDARNARNVRTTHLPADVRWIDHSGLRNVVLVQTPGAPKGRALEQLFWNRSVTTVAVLKGATSVDAFDTKAIRIDDDGRLLVGGRPLRRPLLVEGYGVRADVRDAALVARGSSLRLYRPLETPRLAELDSGFYEDGWVARSGSVTVWPDATGRAHGTLALDLRLPADAEATPLEFRAPGIDRRVVVRPGHRTRVTFAFSSRRPWRLVFRTRKLGVLADGRQVSVRGSARVGLRRRRTLSARLSARSPRGT